MFKLGGKNLLLWLVASFFFVAALSSILLMKAAPAPMTFFIDPQLTENCLNENYDPNTRSCTELIQTGYNAWSTANQGLQSIKNWQDWGTISTGGHTIYVRDGIQRFSIYDLHLPSGTEGRRNTISGYNDERAIFSGANAKDAWTNVGNNIYKTSLTAAEANQKGVYEDDQPLHVARYPEGDEDLLTAQSLTRYALVDSDLDQLSDEQIIDSWMEIMTELDWHVKAKIESYDRETFTATFYTDTENNQLLLPGNYDGYQYREPSMTSSYHLIESINLLNRPGEYYYDVAGETKELYIMTLSGGNPTAHLMEVAARWYTFRLENGAHYLDFKNLEIRHGYIGMYLRGNYEGGSGYLDRGPTDITMDNLYVHHHWNQGIYLRDYVYNVDIINSRVEYNDGVGIYANGYNMGDSDYVDTDIRISNNQVIRNGRSGILVNDNRGAKIYDNYADYNGLYNLNSGISVHSSSYVDVYNNTMLHSGGNGILLEGTVDGNRAHHINVYNNIITDSSWLNDPASFWWVCGLWSSDTDDSYIHDNYFSTPYGRALHVDAGDRNIVTNNTFVDIFDETNLANATAVVLENFDGPAEHTLGYARDNIIAHNIFVGDFQRAIEVFADYPNAELTNLSGNIVANNIFYSTKSGADVNMVELEATVDHDLNSYSNNLFYAPFATGMTFQYHSTVYTNLAGFQQASNQEENSMIANPNFVNFGTENFNLQSNSLAIDAGLVISGLNEDYQGFGPDIGRYEFASGPICGNSIIESGEQCDDGNTVDGDGCSYLCQIEEEDDDPDGEGDPPPPPTEPVCGNNIIETGEQCDDGNTVSDDGCSALCQFEEGTGGEDDIENLVEVINLQGRLVKTSNDPRIYYVTEHNKRYYIPNIQTYLSWFQDFMNVEIIDQVTLTNDFPYKGRLTVKPGNLIKFAGDNKVYVVTSKKVLRLVINTQVFQEFGYNFNKVIHLPEEDFAYYFLGESLISSDIHPSGQLLKHGQYPQVFYIDDNIEYWIPNEITFLSLGFKWQDIITIPVRYWYTRVMDNFNFRLNDW